MKIITHIVYRPKWFQRPNNTMKYSCHIGIKKCDILILDALMVSNNNDIVPTLVSTSTHMKAGNAVSHQGPLCKRQSLVDNPIEYFNCNHLMS